MTGALLVALLLGQTPKMGPIGFSCPTGYAIQLVTGTRDKGRCVAVGGTGGTPAGADTQVQFRDGTAFGADSTFTVNKTTHQVGAYKLKLGITGTAQAIILNNGNQIYWSDGSVIESATGAMSYIAATSHGFDKIVYFQRTGTNDAIQIQNAGARLHLSGIGNNDYFYSTGTASAKIRTPGAIIADGGFEGALTGNASTATSAGTATTATTATALAANGANCTSPQVPLGVDASGAAEGCFTPAGTYSLPDAAAAVKGGVQLAGQLGGTAASPTVVGVTGAVVGVANINATGTPSASTFLRGDGTWNAASGSGAPTTATYITQTADAGLSAEQALSSLTTGIVKVTNGTGVLSTAASGTDYGPPTSGNATGLVISTTTTGAHTAYGGASCTNQFPRSLNASGAPTCASVDLSADTAATLLPIAKGGTNGSATPTSGGIAYGTGTAVAYTAAGTATQSFHGGATPGWSWSPSLTMLTGTWASSATANATGIVGTGGVPMTSPTYAAGAPFAFSCVISTTRPATTNGPRYGVAASSGSVTRISFTTQVGLAAATRTETKLVAAMTTNCAANCSTAMTTGTLAQVEDDFINGTGVMNAQGTISLYMAPSAAAANTAQIGSHCRWF